MRRALPVLLAALLTAGCGGAGGGGKNPGGDTSAHLSLPPHGRLFGLSGGAFQWTGRDPALDIGVTPERVAADTLAVGANSARVPFAWANAEPQRGRADPAYLGLMDRFVAAFERGGGRVLFFLGGPPAWAAAKPADPASPVSPSHYADFANFAALVAHRYPRAAGIETWNEPNASFSWRPHPDPAAYARLQRVTARAIHRAAPRMKVILGGLAGTTTTTAEIVRPGQYLAAMYRAGLKPSDYDALAFHPYPTAVNGSIQSLDGGDFGKLFADFRSAYRKVDPHARIWITETGISTTGPAAVSPKNQGAELPDLVRKLLTLPRVAAVYVHTQYDQPHQPGASPERGYGLLEAEGAASGKPKPAFCALRRLVRHPPHYSGCG